jgi:adenine-specific DNA-methyltransferase
LGAFLRRELDFYIKNEVMHLDDVQDESAPRVEQFLSKIKVIRRIGDKIIKFLEQLEDFQKKLWLKKKFVVETDYCITLDRIPEAFYPEIAANDAQREEWVKQFAIDEIEANLATPGYSIPLSIDFLKANRNLIAETRFLSETSALALIEQIGAAVDGLLVHSDNFQALQLIGTSYRDDVKCIYIDPPYNTDSSSIPYKNNYRHSSWITMMNDRLAALSPTLTEDGAIFVSIDKTERTGLEHVMDDVFGMANKVEELIWSMNTNNSQAPNHSTNHEYVLVYAKDKRIAEQDRGMFREPKPGFEEVMALVSRLNPSFPPITEIESELKALYDQHRITYPNL